MKRRDANLILIALAALGGGIVAYILPLSLFELALATSGLSERFPAFAPPLGDTARLLLTLAAAIACAVVIALVLPWGAAGGRSADRRRERGASFLFARLASLTRGKKAEAAPASLEHRLDTPLLIDAPVLRRSDSHPDAPARQPLFARRDLGEEALPSVEEAAMAAPQQEEPAPEAEAPIAPIRPDAWRRPEAEEEEQADIAPPRAPEPLPWNLIEQEMSRILNGGRPRAESPAVGDDEEAPTAKAAIPAAYDEAEFPPSAPPASLPTIQQLVDRLERGLHRKKLARAGEGRPDDEQAGHGGSSVGSGPAGEDLQRALAALRAAARAG